LKVLDPDNMERRNPHNFVMNSFIRVARYADIDHAARDHDKVAVRHIVTLAICQTNTERHKWLRLAQLQDVFRSHKNTLQF